MKQVQTLHKTSLKEKEKKFNKTKNLHLNTFKYCN